jgi:hypothetical protein
MHSLQTYSRFLKTIKSFFIMNSLISGLFYTSLSQGQGSSHFAQTPQPQTPPLYRDPVWSQGHNPSGNSHHPQSSPYEQGRGYPHQDPHWRGWGRDSRSLPPPHPETYDHRGSYGSQQNPDSRNHPRQRKNLDPYYSFEIRQSVRQTFYGQTFIYLDQLLKLPRFQGFRILEVSVLAQKLYHRPGFLEFVIDGQRQSSSKVAYEGLLNYRLSVFGHKTVNLQTFLDLGVEDIYIESIRLRLSRF